MIKLADPIPRPRALLLDMDGTITAPMLDFARIKREMGIGAQPILEAMAAMNKADRAAAEAVLARHEDEAAERCSLNHGCDQLLAWIAEHGIVTALITRNTRASVQTVLATHGLSFGTLIAREDAPFKPDPRPLRLACERLGVEPADAWMVGDGQYDVEAGRAAEVRTVWVSHNRPRTFDAVPWRTVRDLRELVDLLQSCVAARA
ncbi:MAG: HAD family hydrolase [Planctomycetota bacterium]|nr:HAD family hydrolase [Planctomycetota bacterium]